MLAGLSGPFHTSRFSLVIHSGVCLRPSHRRLSTDVPYPQHTQHGCPRVAQAVAVSVVLFSAQTRVTHAPPAAASRTSGIGTASPARGWGWHGQPCPGWQRSAGGTRGCPCRPGRRRLRWRLPARRCCIAGTARPARAPLSAGPPFGAPR